MTDRASSSLKKSPRNRRDDVDWRMEVRWEPKKTPPSEHDTNSWVDSGAGESISETEVAKSPAPHLTTYHAPLIKKPSFKTFVDDVDERCSIEIFDSNQYVPTYYS